ncbi:MAG TPA: Ig-like domain-containing protein [Gemmatimonadaceae bacterium]|nr:Ig-like domain-containing protein [Gemmatimonadaceae bacterium]
MRAEVSRRWAACTIALVAIIATSCGGGGDTGPVPVASVLVSLANSSVIIGDNTTATATARDASGNTLTGRPIAWSTADPQIATVSSTGSVTATHIGSTRVIATSEGHEGSATLTVTAVPVATVTVTLAPDAVNIGQTVQATASVTDARGHIVTDRTISWSSGSPTVATVSGDGLVTAVGEGVANIVATSEGRTGGASLTVRSPPRVVASVTVTLDAPVIATLSRTRATATPKDAQGVPITGKTVLWQTDKPTVASVSEDGIVTAVSNGTANIFATIDGMPGSAVVTVAASVGFGSSAEKVHIVDIGAPFTPTIGSGGSGISFISRSTSVATVNAQGVISAVTAGQTWIAANAPGFAPDSMYIIVPKNGTGPLLRLDLTKYLFQAGTTSVVVNALIDTRSTPIGGAELSVGVPTRPFILRVTNVTIVGSPAPLVSSSQEGIYRISLASANALSGQLLLVRITFDVAGISSSEVNRSGFFALTLLDIVDPTGADLLPVSTSTRFPIIMQ